jgi:nitroreductase
VEQRASVRQFERVEVPIEHLKRIVDAGRRAPSGKNAQPREFVVVTDPETLKALGAAQECIGQASAAIAIVSDGTSTFWLEDAAASATQMLLAITALGYASVWIQGRLLRVEDEARRILGIPAEKRFAIILPIGKPAAPAAQKEKRGLAEIAHLNRYGQRLA